MRKAVALSTLIPALTLALLAQPTTGRAVHVTLHEGTSMAAALSPDGRTIAIDLLGTLWTLQVEGVVGQFLVERRLLKRHLHGIFFDGTLNDDGLRK